MPCNRRTFVADLMAVSRLRVAFVAIALLFVQLGAGECRCLHANLWFQSIDGGSDCDDHDHHPQEGDCDCSVNVKPSFVSAKQISPEMDGNGPDSAPALILFRFSVAGHIEHFRCCRTLPDSCLAGRDRGSLRAELGVYRC